MRACSSNQKLLERRGGSRGIIYSTDAPSIYSFLSLASSPSGASSSSSLYLFYIHHCAFESVIRHSEDPIAHKRALGKGAENVAAPRHFYVLEECTELSSDQCKAERSKQDCRDKIQ